MFRISDKVGFNSSLLLSEKSFRVIIAQSMRFNTVDMKQVMPSFILTLVVKTSYLIWVHFEVLILSANQY